MPLKSNYDGYHFTWPSPDIYNPFSLLNALTDSKLNSYWFGSGTPTYLIEMLNKYHVKPQQIGARKVLAESFDAPTERMVDITPLLYQSGYITIKDYSSLTNLYTLDIPNKEVRMGLMKSLLPNYLHQYTADGLTTVALLFEAIAGERMDDALRLLQTFLSTIPQCDNTDYEGHYQSLLLHDLQPARNVCGRGSPYPERPCGYGDAHTDNALCRGIEVKQDCGYSP